SENNRDRFCRFLCVGRGIRSNDDEDIDTRCHEFGGHASKLSRLLVGKTVFQHDGFAVDVTDIREALHYRLIVRSLLLGVRGMPKYSDMGDLRGLLCVCSKRPSRRSPEKCNEIAPSHCLPQGSGRDILAAQTCAGKGPAHVRFTPSSRAALSGVVDYFDGPTAIGRMALLVCQIQMFQTPL